MASRYNNQNRSNHGRRDSVKRICAFLAESTDEGAKIGSIIKHHLRAIKEAAGNGIFITFKNADDLKSFDAWCAEHPELAKMSSQGVGWYFWSFNQEATLKAKGAVNDACLKWEEDRRGYKQKQTREREGREKAAKPIPIEDMPQSAFPELSTAKQGPATLANVWTANAAVERDLRAKVPVAPPVEVPQFTPLTRRTDWFQIPLKKTVIINGWEEELDSDDE